MLSKLCPSSFAPLRSFGRSRIVSSLCRSLTTSSNLSSLSSSSSSSSSFRSTSLSSSPSSISSPHSSLFSRSSSSFVHPSSAAPRSTRPKLTIRFSIADHPGALGEALRFFWKHDVNLTRIESRPNKLKKDLVEFYVDFYGTRDDSQVQQLVGDLVAHCASVKWEDSKKVAWFPRHISELDRVANQILDAGAELQSDHPGFHDKEYRERRKIIAENAMKYKYGQSLPRINYTPEEIATWGAVYRRLIPLYAKNAVKEYNELFPSFEKHCGYSDANVPQIGDISSFIQSRTGFTIRPVAGLLSARNFLYGLAFRVFFSTQYLRHHSKPLYTPEPDLVHELMGHAILFADPSFADFSQEIGLASIGATDEQVLQLARCYWFSVEFGVCLQNGERKAYGAGLLSSFGELEYSMSDKPIIKDWDPFTASKQDYPITTYQPIYFAARSFDDAKVKMSQFSNSLARPFNVRYDATTQTIEVDSNVDVLDQ